MKKHSKIMLALLLVAAMLVGTLQMKVNVAAAEGEFTMDRVSGGTQKDVYVKGEQRVVYCMQYDYLWPVTESGYANPITVYREASADEMLLNADQLAQVQKVLFVGYPYNAIGAFNTMYMEYGETYAADFAADLTQGIIWQMMAGWGINGNTHYSAGGEQGSTDDILGWDEAYDKIMEFVQNGQISSVPAEFTPELIGNTEFRKDGDSFRTGKVHITNPEGLSLKYELGLPEGVMPVDEEGIPVGMDYNFYTGEVSFTVSGGSTFYLEYYGADINSIEGEEISITGTFKVPTDVRQYMTDDTGLGDKNDGQGYVQHPFQTMLSIGISSSSYSGTATLKAPTTDITVEKIWKNDTAADRPEFITIHFFANDNPVPEYESVELGPDVNGNWKWTFELPEYDENGDVIEYKITETAVHNYNTTILDWEIINTYAPGKTSFDVLKEWHDDHNHDGLRPGSVKVYLTIDGVRQNDKYVILNEANHWEATFDDLNEKDRNGNPIKYGIEEEAVEGYTVKITGNAEDGFVIENTHKNETVTVSGEKTWVGDTEAARPESITIRLHANGLVYDILEVKPDKEGKWTWSFTDLPKYENQKEVVYTITEDKVKDYDAEVNGYNVTNTFDAGKTSLEVTKVWEDNDDQDGIRPDSVKIYLVIDGEKSDQYVELDQFNNWEGAFHHLPILNTNGKAIEYDVVEEEVKGYEAFIDGNADEGFTVLNYHPTETINISGKKTWVGDAPEARPEHIMIRLHANGVEVDNLVVHPDEEGNWTWVFWDLPKYDGGEEINYNITEDAVLNYDITIDEYNVTNTFDRGNTSLTVEKRWDDDHNNDGIRPEKVTVYLVADGVKTDKSVVISADNKWEATFHHLPVYDLDGSRIIYTVVEAEVPGYVSVVSGDFTKGYLVINSHQVETISISGTKVWDDAEDKDGIRPESITVYLMNGEHKVDRVIVSAEDGWKWTFTDVKKFADGKEVNYTFMEEAVEGYTTKITGSVADGFVITNTHEIKEDPATKPDSNTGNANANNGKPDTGDRSQVGAYMVMLMASMMGIVVSTILNKKERKLRKSK